MVMLYLATAANEILHVGPENPLLFEAQQVALHTMVYAIQAWLLARAVDAPAAALIGLALAIGLGQETLQSLWRGHLTALGSAIDLAVDGMGAALGLWLLGRWRGRERKGPFETLD
jgi:hypothetical protein